MYKFEIKHTTTTVKQAKIRKPAKKIFFAWSIHFFVYINWEFFFGPI